MQQHNRPKRGILQCLYRTQAPKTCNKTFPPLMMMGAYRGNENPNRNQGESYDVVEEESNTYCVKTRGRSISCRALAKMSISTNFESIENSKLTHLN